VSTLPPECEQLLISGYILGNLSPAEALLFEEMLTANPELNEQILAMQETLELVYAPPEISPPATLRDRILATAKTEATAKLNNKSENPLTVRANLPWNKILWAIALAIITTLGIANYRLWQSLETANIIEQTGKRLTYLLNSPDLTQKSTAKLIVNPDRLKATLTVNNLPSLPPDKVYALWTVVGKDVAYTTDEKGAILTAVFQVNESGDFNQEITVPQLYLESKIIDKIAISIEDLSAPQAHQGSIFISTKD
jgi:anti-sigma-K factor RskA